MVSISTTTPVFQPIVIELTPNDGMTDTASWRVRDDEQMLLINRQLERNAKLDRFLNVMDASLAVCSSFLAAQAGTAPSYFPILSMHFGGSLDAPRSVHIEQDKISSTTFASFLAYFIQDRCEHRPKITFQYHNRSDALSLFSKLSGLVNLTQKFGDESRGIPLEESSCSDHEVVSFALSGNHLPSLNRYLQGDQSILLGWAAAKSAKLHNTRDKAQKIVRNTLNQISQQLRTSSPQNREFWLTLYVQLLLDLALLTDGAPSEIQQAITIARQLDNSTLIAHCQRFCNQTLGVSAEALTTLEDSISRFDAIPQNSEEFLIFMPSRIGAKLNHTTTAFIASSDTVDPAKLEADYWEAKETFPSYSSLGMLASSAAVGRMIKGHNRKAVDLLERASLERSLPIDGFNIRTNLLVAQFLHSSTYEEFEFSQLCSDLEGFNFLTAWEYHKIRIGLNLMQIAKEKSHRDRAWELIKNSSFWGVENPTSDHNALMQMLIKKRYSHYLVGNQIGGHFGKLTSRTGLFPAIDKDWS